MYVFIHLINIWMLTEGQELFWCQEHNKLSIQKNLTMMELSVQWKKINKRENVYYIRKCTSTLDGESALEKNKVESRGIESVWLPEFGVDWEDLTSKVTYEQQPDSEEWGWRSGEEEAVTGTAKWEPVTVFKEQPGGHYGWNWVW